MVYPPKSMSDVHFLFYILLLFYILRGYGGMWTVGSQMSTLSSRSISSSAIRRIGAGVRFSGSYRNFRQQNPADTIPCVLQSMVSPSVNSSAFSQYLQKRSISSFFFTFSHLPPRSSTQLSYYSIIGKNPAKIKSFLKFTAAVRKFLSFSIRREPIR